MGDDEKYTLMAIGLAEKGKGRVSPNPLVGAVIVKDGEVVGAGYHEYVGGPHAEINALEDAGGAAKGATLYVTLEPCNHFGRTPPCTEAIRNSGIEKVVVTIRDPNQQVSGNGMATLANAGIDVEDGPFEEVAKRQNEAYLKWAIEKMPFVTLKMAATLDGKTATAAGSANWISSEVSRREVHAMRACSDAVLVGIGTVLSDDPRLTVRDYDRGFNPPIRIVLDSAARTPVDSNVVTDSGADTLIAVTDLAPDEKVRELERSGVEVRKFGEGGRVDLSSLLKSLAEREIASVLCEGGGDLSFSLMQAGLIDKCVFYLAPMMIGGRCAPGLVGGAGIEDLQDAFKLEIDSVSFSGPDIRVISYPEGGR
ncbi:MAG: bifunctional diaminohydroxyphosphoribosylaminopyrimidine deaminase/5-amino-6-(5-phosphoribosylamino)uracil reductase RibD [Actinobacteria bacterium]|nr:bifunctional diaminohydroxyphosphoribosylaminopyrimidine deaminase/5-amino-6-(5-phosphoribosylamino)uracil reductase RibD [Actinomycetota bacterium]